MCRFLLQTATFSFTLVAYNLGNAFFGQGSGVIHLDSVECTGSERRLVDCNSRAADLYDYHSKDVGVRCIVCEWMCYLYEAKALFCPLLYNYTHAN